VPRAVSQSLAGIKNAPERLYLIILLMPLVFSFWGGVNSYELPQQVWMMLFATVFLASFGLFMLTEKKLSLGWHRGVMIITGLWALSLIASTVFSPTPLQSFWGDYLRMQGLLTHFFYGLHFLICLTLFRDKKLRELVFPVIIGVGVIVALYAIVQWLIFDPTMAFGLFGRRSFSTLGSPNDLGQLLIFPLSSLVFFAASHLRKKPLLKKTSTFRAQQLLLVGSGLILVAGLLTSQNRASLLGLLVAGTLLPLSRLKSKKSLFLTGGGLILLTIGLLVLLNPSLRSLGTRSVLWQSSLKLVDERLIFGHGLESFQQAIQPVLTPSINLYERLTDLPDRAHNLLIEAFVTRGLFGLSLVIMALVILGFLLVRKKCTTPAAQAAWLGVTAYTIAVFFGFSSAVHIIFLLSFWTILLHETLSIESRTIPLPLFGRAGLALLTLTGLVATGLYGTRLLAADRLFDQGIGSFIYAPQEAFDELHESIRLTPQFAYHYKTAFIFFTSPAPLTDDAGERLEEYAKKLGTITGNGLQYELSRAQLALFNDRYEEATTHLARAHELAPSWPSVLIRLGDAARENEDYVGAIKAYEKMIELSPPYWRWPVDKGEELTEAEREQVRIFRISNQSFYEALTDLVTSYEAAGLTDDAANLAVYL